MDLAKIRGKRHIGDEAPSRVEVEHHGHGTVRVIRREIQRPEFHATTQSLVLEVNYTLSMREAMTNLDPARLKQLIERELWLLLRQSVLERVPLPSPAPHAPCSRCGHIP